MSDQDLRTLAVRAAVDAGCLPHEVVEAAQTIYAFLTAPAGPTAVMKFAEASIKALDA